MMTTAAVMMMMTMMRRMRMRTRMRSSLEQAPTLPQGNGQENLQERLTKGDMGLQALRKVSGQPWQASRIPDQMILIRRKKQVV